MKHTMYDKFSFKRLMLIVSLAIAISATIYISTGESDLANWGQSISIEEKIHEDSEKFSSSAKGLNYEQESPKFNEENKMAEEIRRGYKIEIFSRPSMIAREISPLRETDEGDIDQDETLLIDGDNVPYLRTKDGYRIFYNPPQSSLLEAARNYIDTQREKSQ